MPTRLPAVLVALALCLLAAPVSPSIARASGPRLDSGERALLRALNQTRRAHGLRRLRACRLLARAADGHSRDMSARGFFGHASSDGTTFGRRVARHTKASRIGENLAYLPQGGTPQAVVNMWMGSAGHRQILLDPRFDRVGIASRQASAASVVTADFASNR